MKLKDFLAECAGNQERLREGIEKSYTVRHFTETLDRYLKQGTPQNTCRAFVTRWLDEEVDGI